MVREYGWFCDIETDCKKVIVEYRHDTKTQKYYIRNRVVSSVSRPLNMGLTGNTINSSELRSPEFPRIPSATRPEYFTNSEHEPNDTYTIDMYDTINFVEYANDITDMKDLDTLEIQQNPPNYVWYSMIACVLYIVLCV
jgi:hypothetical protein